MIKLENVSKSYGNQQVLSGFSLDIKDGERVAIMGRSGAGKTTLINLILGLIKSDSGAVKVSKDATFGMVFQSTLRRMHMMIISAALPAFHRYLIRNEASPNTIAKYLRDVNLLARIAGDRIESPEQLLQFKMTLQQRGYAVRSINSLLSAVNQFVCFRGHPEWKTRLMKWQRVLFANEKREIRQQEY